MIKNNAIIEIDPKIFSKSIVLKAAYELWDKADFEIKTKMKTIIVEMSLKDKKHQIKDIKKEFNQELIFHKLREDIDKKTSKTRFKIIETALGFWLSLDKLKDEISEIINILELSSQTGTNKTKENEYSLDNVIKQIEDDPEFADDKDEIISILKDIKQ